MLTQFTPVVPTQEVYRILLQAMAHPCRPYTLDPENWPTLLLAIAQTLLDHEVSFCFHPNTPDAWAEELFTLTKSRKADWEEADYLIIAGECPPEDLKRLKRGIPLFPDKGATVIQILDGPYPQPGPQLSGPGLQSKGSPPCNILSPGEWAAYKEINADYPLGIDLISIVGRKTICCLPRSTRIEPTT